LILAARALIPPQSLLYLREGTFEIRFLVGHGEEGSEREVEERAKKM